MLHANAISDNLASLYFWGLLAVGIICYCIIRYRRNKGVYDKSDLWLVVYLCCIACMTGALGLMAIYGIIPDFLPPVASPEPLFMR